MKNTKLGKIITITSLVCIAISVLLGILMIIELVPANDIIGKIYLTLLTIFMTGLFLLNALKAITEKNIYGYICFGLLALSALLFIINIWLPYCDFYLILIKITIVIAGLTILFDFIVGNVLTIKKSYMWLQIGEYVTFSYIIMCVIVLIFGSDFFFRDAMVTVLCVIALLGVGSFVALAIMKKSYKEKNPDESDEYIKIKKSEYEALLNRIKELESK